MMHTKSKASTTKPRKPIIKSLSKSLIYLYTMLLVGVLSMKDLNQRLLDEYKDPEAVSMDYLSESQGHGDQVPVESAPAQRSEDPSKFTHHGVSRRVRDKSLFYQLRKFLMILSEQISQTGKPKLPDGNYEYKGVTVGDELKNQAVKTFRPNYTKYLLDKVMSELEELTTAWEPPKNIKDVETWSKKKIAWTFFMASIKILVGVSGLHKHHTLEGFIEIVEVLHKSETLIEGLEKMAKVFKKAGRRIKDSFMRLVNKMRKQKREQKEREQKTGILDELPSNEMKRVKLVREVLKNLLSHLNNRDVMVELNGLEDEKYNSITTFQTNLTAKLQEITAKQVKRQAGHVVYWLDKKNQEMGT